MCEWTEEKSWTACIFFIVAGVVLVTAITLNHYTQRIRWYTERGYTQTTLPGTGCPQWVKGDSTVAH
jgi:hypothetical protein